MACVLQQSTCIIIQATVEIKVILVREQVNVGNIDIFVHDHCDDCLGKLSSFPISHRNTVKSMLLFIGTYVHLL